jgi:hypothetical protein
LEKTVVYNDDERQLFYDAMSKLKNYDLIKEQMNIVRQKHTFLNRIRDLLMALGI